MNSSTKITLKSQSGTGAKYAFQKVPMIIRTVFNLALVNGYDKNMRIRNRNGEFINNSNLLDLLNHAMSVGKNLHASNEFVELLAEADVNPDWIINDQIKQMLIAKRGSRSNNDERPPPPQPPPQPGNPLPINPITTGSYWGPERVTQRRLATFTRPKNLKRTRNLVPYTPSASPSPPPSQHSSLRAASPPPSLPDEQRSMSPQMPTLDRMDVPPASPPRSMPTLKRVRSREEDIFNEPEPKHRRLDNKSDDEWLPLPPDDENDDW